MFVLIDVFPTKVHTKYFQKQTKSLINGPFELYLLFEYQNKQGITNLKVLGITTCIVNLVLFSAIIS